mgnify:CR=1 FL=1
MKKRIPLACFAVLFPVFSHAELTQSQFVAISGAVSSVGSSALVSGLILSPITIPAGLVIKAVEGSKEKKAATIKAKSDKGEEVELRVPEQVVTEAALQPGDKLQLTKAPQGTGALLEKNGKVITHMLYENDAGLSQNQLLPGAK